MRIGLFLTPQWPAGADLEQGLRDVRAQVRAARDSGFTSLLVGQHMLTAPMQMLQPMPLLGHLLREAEGMQIGPGVLLLSMVNPVMAAEESATLDWMSGGRFVLAAGLGYRPQEFEAMGAPIERRVSRLTEALEVVARLWTEERVTHHGQHFDLSDVGASVRPKQSPRPPIWLGGDVENAVRRAARLADAWIAAPTNTMVRLAELMAVFNQERKQSGRPRVVCPVIRECFIGRDTTHARTVSRGPLLYKYEAYAAWGQTDTGSSGGLAERFDDFVTDCFIVGDEIRVVDELNRYRDDLGLDHLLLRLQWPGLDQKETMGNIDRVGKILARLT